MKNLTDITNDISTTLNETGYDLIKEDRESLYQLLQSKQFLEDLKAQNFNKDLGLESYFLIAILQIRRKLKEKETYFHLFKKIYQKTKKSVPEKNNILNKLEDNKVIKFIVHICNYFIDTKFLSKIPGQKESGEYKYIYKIIEELRDSNNKRRYYLSYHIGNLSLFKTTIGRKNIEHRNTINKSPMTLKDYKKYGLKYYGKASEHDLAKDKNQSQTLKTIKSNFDTVRSIIDLTFEDFTDF